RRHGSNRVYPTAAMWLLLVAIFAATGPAFGGSVAQYVKKSGEWFRTEEAKKIAANVSSWQASEGGWPKNSDTTAPFTGEREKLRSTFDNGATTDELRFLARMMDATN